MKYIPILKTKKGEFQAIARFLVDEGSKYVLPFFDLTYPDKDKLHGNMPFHSYLEKKTNEIREVFQCKDNQTDLLSPAFEKCCLIDNHYWPDANQSLENKEHPLEYLANNLIDSGISVVPIIGLDRWDLEEAPLYVQAIKNICKLSEVKTSCLRIDEDYITDIAMYEPEEFLQHIHDILDGIGFVPEDCNIILDFGFIASEESLESVSNHCVETIRLLKEFNFKSFTLAGGSIPRFVSDVAGKNSTNTIPRIEFLVWKKLSKQYPKLQIGFADYGTRNPEASDNIKNPVHINGKVWYTIENSHLVARGSSLNGKSIHEKGDQFRLLAEEIIDSTYWSTYSRCWGDKEIFRSLMKPIVNFTKWVSISTNRHISYVAKEVYEHQTLVRPKDQRKPSEKDPRIS